MTFRRLTVLLFAAAMVAPVARASTGAESEEIASTVAAASLSGSFLAAQLAARDNDDPAAVAFYEKGVALDPDNVELRQLLFLALAANGRIDKAIEIAASLPSGLDNSPVARIVGAVDALKRNAWHKVAELLAKPASGDLDRLIEDMIKAWALFGEGRRDEAVALAKAQQGPDWVAVVANHHAGLMLAAAGNLREAATAFEAATRNEVAAAVMTETFLRATDANVRTLHRLGETDKAHEALKRGMDLVTNHPPFKQLERQLGDKTPLPLLAANPTEGAAELFYNIGTAIGRQGGGTFAQTYLQIAKHLNPASDTISMGLAGVFENNNYHERANQQYRQIAEDSAYYRRARVEYALNLNEMKDTETAKSVLRELIAKDPEDMVAYSTLGSVLNQHEEYSAAAEVYDAAVARLANPQPQHWNIFYRRGIAYERLKAWDKAEPNFRKSLELSPNQADVLNYLGYSWVDMGRNLDEGMNLIRKAVELKPRSGFIVDSLGWAHYRLGQYDEAVVHLERAVELMPGDPVVNDHLGDAYWKTGRKLEARFQWMHAIEAKPEAEEEAKIKAKLQSGLVDENPTKP
jgi:tetratricopeptide (TPR) repeat protein